MSELTEALREVEIEEDFRWEELEWVDDTSGCECARCRKVVVSMRVADCGHRFCPNCCKVLDDGSQRWKCPTCRTFIKRFDAEADPDYKNQVRALKAHCPNRRYGCPFVAQLQHLQVHLSECQMTKEKALPVLSKETPIMQAILSQITTMNERVSRLTSQVNVIEEKVERLEEEQSEGQLKVDINFRELQNEIKGLRGECTQQWTKQEAADHHCDAENIKVELSNQIQLVENNIKNNSNLISEFNKEIFKCQMKTAEAEGKIKQSEESTDRKLDRLRDGLSEHFKKQFTAINTKLFTLAAKNEKLRANNLTRDFHLQTAKNKIYELEDYVISTNPQIKNFNVLDGHLKLRADCTWRISEISKMMKQTTFAVTSEVFPLPGYPFSGQSKLEMSSDGIVKATLAFVDRKRSGEAVELKVLPRVYCLLKDQTGSERCRDFMNSKNCFFGSKLSYDAFGYESLKVHKSWFLSRVYTVEDAVEFEIHVEPPAVARHVYSRDGTLDWSINHYSERMRIEKENLIGCQETPYFYTAIDGYRVQAIVHLNGFGANNGKGLTVGIDFLTGELDSGLTKLFHHRTTVTVVNPRDHALNIVKSVEQNIKAQQWYVIDVASHKDVASAIFDDKLFFKVLIEPIVK